MFKHSVSYEMNMDIIWSYLKNLHNLDSPHKQVFQCVKNGYVCLNVCVCNSLTFIFLILFI